MTLRHLTIRRMHVSLHDLLLACPNLASLTLHENYNFDFKCITLTTWPTLTALSIPDISGHVAYDEMAQICKSFPSLQKLELYNCADMQCVFLVTDSFPSLTYLSLDISSFGVTIKSSNRGKRHDGITHLDICGSITPNVTSKVIFSLLKQHHTTLERLKWRMHVDRDAHDVFSIAYPRLKILLLGGSGSWIPRNAPLLEEMEITYGTIDHHPNLQDFIPAKLKKLKMDFWPHDKLQHTTFITRYFHRYSARPNTTYFLNELIIHTFYKMENAEILFEGICHLTQLERLVIFYLDWNASEMETFIDQLANGCHRLSCLKLFTRVMPSPHAVHALKPLEHLNHLAFDIEDKDHTEGRFWDAIETLNQVKRIEVYCLKMTQLLEIRRVKAKRPDMEVVVKTKHRLPSDLYL